jgi:phospholipid/cholesterol/gamma-HCH transport system substrate-binding protein
MKMQRSNTDVWVGMLVLLGAAALLFLAMQSANLLSISWHKTYSVYAYFDNIGGLKKQAAIKSAGVVVGRVQDIRFDDKNYQAKVELALDVQYQLKILTSGLLGEQYIGIEAGSDAANLAAGDKVQSTQSAVVLENLISRFLFNKAADGPAPSGSQ